MGSKINAKKMVFNHHFRQAIKGDEKNMLIWLALTED